MELENTQQIALYKALSKAQAQMTHATKDAVNPAFKSRYADLSAVIDATIPHLNANGLSLIQLPTFESLPDGSTNFVLVTKLLHDGGGTIECRTPIVVRDSTNPQSFGSGITYARRYSLSALCCIAQEDDDGESAKSGQVQTKPPATKPVDKRMMFEDAVKKLGLTPQKIGDVIGRLGYESLSEAKESEFNEIYFALKA